MKLYCPQEKGTAACLLLPNGRDKMFIKNIVLGSVVVASLLLTGCASIVNGTNQVVSIEARNKGEQVVGAQCSLVNPKGTFYVTTPGTVTIHRAYDDLNVKCEKEGMPAGIVSVKSVTKGMAFGNLLFGGVVGVAIDAGSGAAYDYPALISVIMGESIAQAPGLTSQSPTESTKASGATVPIAQK
jgi:hypothetical protein